MLRKARVFSYIDNKQKLFYQIWKVDTDSTIDIWNSRSKDKHLRSCLKKLFYKTKYYPILFWKYNWIFVLHFVIFIDVKTLLIPEVLCLSSLLHLLSFSLLYVIQIFHFKNENKDPYFFFFFPFSYKNFSNFYCFLSFSVCNSLY